nr:unnamed protein product [Naegleria fowleri]
MPPGAAALKEKLESVKVCVRCRPFNQTEIEKKSKKCVEIDKNLNQVILTKNENEPPKPPFTFDAVFDMDATQLEVFQSTAKPIVESVMDGYNGTVFCYGQTGSGKTHTMEGKPEPPELRGLIYNSFCRIFELIDEAPKDKNYVISVSMIEIYNEEIRDLLVPKSEAGKKLELKETKEGVDVKANNIIVKELKAIDKILAIGSKNRAKGETNMNKDSSRSHSILTIKIESTVDGLVDKKVHIRAGKLNMVDLAGSERADKTGATGDRLKEGCKINLSLSALGNVISALVEGKGKHVPYRDSKLTRLLQDSLGGNTKTVMVANFSPADFNYEETLSTLRYADRAKHIQNKPKINEDPKDAMLRQLKEEIENLRAQLQQTQAQSQAPVVVGSSTTTVIVSDNSQPMVLSASVNEEELERMKLEKEKEKQKIIEEMKQKSAEEKKILLEQQKRIEEERIKIENELRARHEALERERKHKLEIQNKLMELQSRLVQGGQLEQINEEQREQLIKQKQALEEKERLELQLRREMEEQQEKNLVMEEKYTSIQDEVQIKTKKLKKLWSKFEAAKAEISDLQKEFQQEREDYLYTIRQLERELKLRTKIMEHFIPAEEVKKIEERAVWDDEEDEWKIQSVFLAGNHQRKNRPISASGLKRPVAYSVLGNPNPRYKADNIIDLPMEMPERTTEDYRYMEEHEPVSVYASTNFEPEVTSSVQRKSRPSSSNPTKVSRPKTDKRTAPTSEEYPSSRGLVRKN